MTGPHKESSLDCILSWLALGVMSVTAMCAAWYVLTYRDNMAKVFSDFHLRLPPAT